VVVDMLSSLRSSRHEDWAAARGECKKRKADTRVSDDDVAGSKLRRELFAWYARPGLDR
jgi:hypothetical protein